jgi:glutamate 5-kinase
MTKPLVYIPGKAFTDIAFLKYDPRSALDRVKNIVIKIGTAALKNKTTGELEEQVIKELARQSSALMNQGKRITIVSSGALGSGMAEYGLNREPEDIVDLQALCAIGQPDLMSVYKRYFQTHYQHIGQVLLKDGAISPANIKTMDVMYKRYNAIPIVNENDVETTVELEELKQGRDNDRLAAELSTRLKAELLIVLTDQKGFYDGDPKEKDAKLISYVLGIDEDMEKMANDSDSVFTRGGMTSKLRISKYYDGDYIIASGKDMNIILDILNGKMIGTYIVGKKYGLLSR